MPSRRSAVCVEPVTGEPVVDGALVWVSNIPTPYKQVLLGAIADRAPLEAHYLASTEPGREWRLPVRTLRCLRIRYREAAVYLLLTRRPDLRGRACLILPGWENPASWQLLLRARRLDLPVLGFYESTLSSRRFVRGPVALVRRQFFRRVDVVLTPGPAAAAAVLQMGVAPSRVHSGVNAVDVRAFSEGVARIRSSSSSGVGAGHRFLYIGQLISRKNVAAALEAFHAVAAAEDEFAIVGTGPLLPQLMALATGLGRAGQVHFLGHREGEDLLAAYAAAQTLVLPSHEEVWGMVVNEALSAGLHVVVTSEAGVVSTVRHMRGVFTAVPEPAALAEQMSRSRETWQGPVPEPEMLQHTPERAAAAVVKAVEVAREVRARGR